MKILFMGNSITRHPPKTELGWDGDYGMAASRPENDYVHVLCDMLEKRGKHVICKAENISDIEVNPCEEVVEKIKTLRDFGADIAIIRIGENVSDEKADEFGKFLPSLINGFKKSAVFVVSSFWKQPKTIQITKEAAEKCGVNYISLESIQSEEYEAIGEFEHAGVAAHPSDKGMKAIAEMIFEAIEKAGILSSPSIPDFHDDWGEKPDYSVTVDGREVKCHKCRVSKMPFNTVWPGHQRPIEQTEVDSFISFDMDSPADIRVKLVRRPEDISIRPLSENIDYEVLGDTVYFTIKKAGQYTFEVDGRHNILHIFANKKESFDTENATYKFENGVFDAGRIHLKSNESVYIGAGAVVYGEIDSADSENIRIFGRGILDGSKYKRSTGNCEIGKDGLINFARCRNIKIDGIILRDSCMWTVTSINCTDVDFRNVKVIGMWRYNSDGFDFVNSQNVHVSDCFLRTFDDSIVLKGLRLDDKKEIEKMNMKNYLIENCVIWCDWGGALEIGAETVADEYKNIVFRNCSIIRTDQGAMRIHSGDRAEIHDVLYENITVEYSEYDQRNIYQESDDMIYEPGDVPAHDAFIKDWMYCGVWTDDNILGHVHDIKYSGIYIIKDEKVPEPTAILEGGDETHPMENITIENVYINGEKFEPQIKKNDFTKNIHRIS